MEAGHVRKNHQYGDHSKFYDALREKRQRCSEAMRNFLNMDRPEHHSIDPLKERGVEKGSGRHPTLQGRERSVFNQANIGTISRVTLWRVLRDGWGGGGGERIWAFPTATMQS